MESNTNSNHEDQDPYSVFKDVSETSSIMEKEVKKEEENLKNLIGNDIINQYLNNAFSGYSLEGEKEIKKEEEAMNYLQQLDASSKQEIIDNRESLKNRIQQLRDGSFRNKMIPIVIPETVKKMTDFPKTNSLKTKNYPAKQETAVDEDLLDLITNNKDIMGLPSKGEGNKKEEEFTVTLRVPQSVHSKLTKMVIQRSADTGEILNKSSYLRLLIEKDFKERTKIQF